jgi:hypothetical protein
MAPKIKSNDRMPARSYAQLQTFVDHVANMPGGQREEALHFMGSVSPHDLFEILHSMRRWYSGQTMARALLSYREDLRSVMKIEPKDALGVYRGFKVDKGDPLAGVRPGDCRCIPVTRNHGFSSWSLTEAPTHRFSGAGNGKVGLVVKLVESQGVRPVLAPPERTAPWFNALYQYAIGTSFRPTEGEYLIAATRICIEVVRVKK